MKTASTILVIDDSVFTCSLIRNILSTDKMIINAAYTAKQAFDWLGDHEPDLILLNLVMPGLSGYEVCSKLIGEYGMADVPIIFLTSSNDEKSIVQAFEAGATDYIIKPFSPPELRARVHCHLKNKSTADELRITNQKLEHAMTELRLQGMKDPLTSLFNRRYFIENMEEWRTTFRNNDAFLAIIDIDGFKQVNDTYGHCTGDYVLYTIADIIVECIGENAAAGRWGGDEFVVLLSKSSPKAAQSIGYRIVQRVCSHDFHYDGKRFCCSVTAGMSRFDPALNIEQNIANADSAMYEGKKNGRNRFVFHDQQTE